MDQFNKFLDGQTVKATSTVEDLLRIVRSVNETAQCLDVLELFHHDKDLNALPVVNNSEQPIGLVTRLSLTEFFSKQFTKEIKGKKPISILMDTNVVIVEKTSGIEDVAKIILDAGIQHMVTGFIITERNQYLGMATILGS
jgi:CBS domain-containing protein